MVSGSTYLLPPLSSGGASIAVPSLRFHILLIEPDMQISRIRLSDKTHAFAHERLCAVHPTHSTGPCCPGVHRPSVLHTTANATTWAVIRFPDRNPGSSFASACGAFRSSRTLPEFPRVAPISRALPLSAPVLNQGPFPPPELPGFPGTTGLSATP